MKQFYAFLLVLFLSSCMCDEACQNYRDNERVWYSDNGHVKVLSTTAMIGDLVRRVGGDHVDNLTLIRGELDPHSYQLVKGDDEKFSFADLIFYNGLGLEHGPGVQKILAEKSESYPLGDVILADNSDQVLRFNGQVDPHIWMDVSLFASTVPVIVDRLSLYDPDHADDYSKNGAALEQELQALHADILQQLQSIPAERRYLVTSHDAFNYFARAYLAEPGERADGTWQKRFQAPEGLAPESQLSAADIRFIIDHMKRYDIVMIFPETNVSRDSIRKIVEAGREQGMQLMIADEPLFGDAMGQPGSDGDTYDKMIGHNARLLVRALNGSRGSR